MFYAVMPRLCAGISYALGILCCIKVQMFYAVGILYRIKVQVFYAIGVID